MNFIIPSGPDEKSPKVRRPFFVLEIRRVKEDFSNKLLIKIPRIVQSTWDSSTLVWMVNGTIEWSSTSRRIDGMEWNGIFSVENAWSDGSARHVQRAPTAARASAPRTTVCAVAYPSTNRHMNYKPAVYGIIKWTNQLVNELIKLFFFVQTFFHYYKWIFFHN